MHGLIAENVTNEPLMKIRKKTFKIILKQINYENDNL